MQITNGMSQVDIVTFCLSAGYNNSSSHTSDLCLSPNRVVIGASRRAHLNKLPKLSLLPGTKEIQIVTGKIAEFL